MSMTDAVVAVWGGADRLGQAVQSEYDLIPLLRQGLPFTTLEATMTAFGLSRDDVTTLLHLPPRTLSRRRQTRRLAADESDRLYRLTRILAHAERTLESRQKAIDWLRRPNRALNGDSPLRLIDTDIGAGQVDDILGRIEHGIFS